jgi:hypothetical protein
MLGLLQSEVRAEPDIIDILFSTPNKEQITIFCAYDILLFSDVSLQ